MKHLLAVAELNGWTEALTVLVDTDQISFDAASELSNLSGDYVRTYLLGKKVNGKALSEFQQDDDFFEKAKNELNNTFKNGEVI